jgi:threonine/homoserine/homoserine lactone efflux protein
MSATLVLVSVFAVFLPALILPGPDFVAVVRTALTRGTAAGILTSLGVATGLALYAALSLLGLSAILVQHQWLAWAVRALGGCYLVYLGLRLVFTRTETNVATAENALRPPGARPSRTFVFGFLVTLTNPKAIVLFASVFATAVTATTPLWLMVTMVALVFASALLWYACVSWFMASAAVRARVARAGHWVERTAGLSFIAVGGRILADTRQPLSP